VGRNGVDLGHPESHACKGVDEWLSVRGFAPERNPESKEATAVRPWSFTILKSLLTLYKFRNKISRFHVDVRIFLQP